MNAYLNIIGMETLGLGMERVCNNAFRLAQALRSWKVYLSTICCWSPVHIMNWQKNSLVERAERF